MTVSTLPLMMGRTRTGLYFEAVKAAFCKPAFPLLAATFRTLSTRSGSHRSNNPATSLITLNGVAPNRPEADAGPRGRFHT
jgi:hypothetical protein